MLVAHDGDDQLVDVRDATADLHCSHRALEQVQSLTRGEQLLVQRIDRRAAKAEGKLSAGGSFGQEHRVGAAVRRGETKTLRAPHESCDRPGRWEASRVKMSSRCVRRSGIPSNRG